MATAAKFVQPIVNFFGLSRSTRCGCCSYPVSSISVWRVTCYDHFCVFHFFSILAVSMAMAAILEKSTLTGTTSHGMIFLQGFIKLDQGISEKCVGQTFDGRKKERKKNNNKKNTVIRNGANTICLPNFVWGT